MGVVSLENCLLFLSRSRDSFKLLKLIELADPLDHLHGRPGLLTLSLNYVMI